MEDTIEAIKANLFPAAHAAITDWYGFPWHRHKGVIQASKAGSSQALAIDIFGTIKVSSEKDLILTELASRCGISSNGRWSLELEWIDPNNSLAEPRPTQVDALAFGQTGLLLIECKFREASGACSQPTALTAGKHRGLRQCTGDYVTQKNPVNGRIARCALTGKGVRYWEFIPKIFGLADDADHRPCPFRGDAYQWMRNLVLAEFLGSARGIPARVVAAYADGGRLLTADKVRNNRALGLSTGSTVPMITSFSYQAIVEIAKSISKEPALWDALGEWIGRKVSRFSQPQ